jgi:hypothetical protein
VRKQLKSHVSTRLQRRRGGTACDLSIEPRRSSGGDAAGVQRAREAAGRQRALGRKRCVRVRVCVCMCMGGGGGGERKLAAEARRAGTAPGPVMGSNR